MKVEELLETAYRNKRIYGSVRSWLDKYGITPADVAQAMDQVKKSPIFKELADAGVKYNPRPTLEKKGTLNFRVTRTYYRPSLGNFFSSPGSYQVYPNGQIRGATINHGSEAQGLRNTELPQLSKDNPVESVVKTYTAALQRLLSIWKKSAASMTREKLKARAVGVKVPDLPKLQRGDVKAKERYLKKLQSLSDKEGDTRKSRWHIGAARHLGLNFKELDHIESDLDKRDLAKRLDLTVQDLYMLLSGDPVAKHGFLKNIEDKINHQHYGFSTAKGIINDAKRVGINFPEFKRLEKEIEETQIAYSLHIQRQDLPKLIAGDKEAQERFIKALLKSAKDSLFNAKTIIKSARELGINLPEFKVIEKSIQADAKKEHDY